MPTSRYPSGRKWLPALAATVFGIFFSTTVYAADPFSLMSSISAAAGAKTTPDKIYAQVEKARNSQHCTEAEAWSLIGGGYVAAGRVEPALYCFAQAAKKAPKQAIHLNNLGFLLLDQSRYDTAEVFLTAALDRTPDAPEILMNLGKLRWQTGQTREGLGLMAQASEETRQPSYAHCYATALHEDGQDKAATRVLDDTLRRHPDHEPSLRLYQTITGEQWKERARELAEEALDLAAQAQAFVGEWAQVIGRIETQSGGAQMPDVSREILRKLTPEQRAAIQKARQMAARPNARQMAAFHISISKALAGTVRQAMADPHVTNEQLAAQALQCYSFQIQTFAKMYHAFYVSAYLWDHFHPRPHFKFAASGGYQFKHDRSPFNQELFAYLDTCKGKECCPQLVPVATTYLTAMPPRFLKMGDHMNAALLQVRRLDAGLLETYDAYHHRIARLLKTPLYNRMAAQNEDLTHNFFNPSTTSYASPTSILPLGSKRNDLKPTLMPGAMGDATPMGFRWCLDLNRDQLEDFLGYHQGHLNNAALDLADCGRSRPQEEGRPDIDQLLLDALKEAQEEGTTGAVGINLVVCEFTVGTDGVVQLIMGQGVQGIGYYNTINDSWGLKTGAGINIDNPGPVAVGVSAGSYIVYDSSKGVGQEYAYSGTAAGVQITHTDPVWFSSLL